LVAALVLCLGWAGSAQVTYTTTTVADAFLCTGSPENPELNGADLSGLNFGAAGTLAVAPAASPKGEFQSVLRFDLSEAVTLFDSTFGSNHWLIGGISLQLTSNDGAAGVQPKNGLFPVINGGQFVIEWLSDTNWAEGTGTPNLPTTDGVCYDSIPTLLTGPTDILCTNTYTPPGTNVPVIYPLPLNSNLVASIAAGGEVSLLFYAADEQIGYLFNSHEFGGSNVPLINVVAVPLLEILSAGFSNGTFYLTGVGGVSATYQVQATTNLGETNWETIGTADSDTNGAIQYADPSATNQPQRFYRLAGD
jgi:hypothetical protein